MSLKLGVNIDHIATLRQARQEAFPDPVDAAAVCLSTGADYIVVHLRKDARHINEKDVARLCKNFPGKIHLECSCDGKSGAKIQTLLRLHRAGKTRRSHHHRRA